MNDVKYFWERKFDNIREATIGLNNRKVIGGLDKDSFSRLMVMEAQKEWVVKKT